MSDAAESLTSEEDHLRWYINKYESSYGQSTLPGADKLRKVMSPGSRLKAKQLATNAQSAGTRRRATQLARSADVIRLHLGCGWNLLDGWINIDLVGGKTDLVWNLRKALPFLSGSADAVFL